VPFIYFLVRKQAAVWAAPRSILEQA